MWIISQDKEELRNVNDIEIIKFDGEKYTTILGEKKTMRRKKMAKLTQAQKDAYIAELEEKIEEADKIANDQLNVYKFNSHSKKHKKITQRTAQAWLLVALVITLLLSIMNMCILSMYLDMFEQVGGYQYEAFKENRG